ncbi:PleD family two-component system response regulator [Insolitispirillum peregrinum]|uniref:diguanylate cyclase domain-containing protein n=1 Tax=Insolitispirillum peregrinum TaxID=80876 RepID=UPI0036D383BB
MHTVATILLATPHPDAVAALLTSLSRSGYACRLTSPDTLSSAIAQEAPDILLLGPGFSGNMLETALHSAANAPCPALLLAAPGDEAAVISAQEHALAGILPWPDSLDALPYYLHPLTRLATMQSELARRQQTCHLPATAAGHGNPSLSDPPASVLIISTHPSVASLQATLAPEVDVTTAPDTFSAQSLMEGRRFDACIMVPDTDREALFDLCLQIRRNPRLFNLPVLFLDDEQPLKALSMGASHGLPLSASAADVRFALRTLVQRQRQRWALRQAMEQTRSAPFASPIAREAYNSQFMDQYARAFLAERTHPHAFAVVGLLFAGVDAIEHEFGADAEHNLIAQIAQWLTLLVRAEDMVVHLDGARFCVILPDTPPEEAALVMNRIAGVISNTDFAVRDVYRVVTVWPYVVPMDLTLCQQAPSLATEVIQVLESKTALL